MSRSSKKLTSWLVAGAVIAWAPGCSFLSNMFSGQGQAGSAQAAGPRGPSADERFLEEVAAKRKAAEDAPGNLDAAVEYVSYVYAGATQGVYERNELDPKARVEDAVLILQGVEGDDTTKAKAKAVEAMLVEYLGDADRQGTLLQESYALDPEAGAWDALVVWHGQRGADDEVVTLCKAKREALDYSDALLTALSVCLQARNASSVESGLDFVSKADRAWYDAEMRRIAAEMEAARAEEERRLAEARAREEAQRAAEAEARAASSSSGASSAGASSGPVSVTLRNRCRETVKVFFGDKPKFGSGRYSSMSSNSSTSHSFQPGDMFWIVDDGQNPISSVTVSPGMREIEILDSCTGMRTR